METVDFELDLTDITTDLNIEVENITPMIKEVEVIVPEYIEVDTKMGKFIRREPFEITESDFEGMTEIPSYLFYHSSIEKVTIPSTIAKIGTYAFSNCLKLKSIKIQGNTLTEIPSDCFYRCNALEEVTIPKSVVKFVSNSFQSCGAKAVYYGGTIDEWCQIDIANGTASPSNFTSGVWGTNVSCDYYFEGNLTKNAVISAETIAKYALTNASLGTLKIEDTVTSINEGAFSTCTKLASITIGKGVTAIEKNAFRSCGSGVSGERILTMLPTTPPTIQSYTFEYAVFTKIIVPKGCLDVYKSATNWTKLASKMVEATE